MDEREYLERDIMFMFLLLNQEEQEEVYERFCGYLLQKAYKEEHGER